MKEFKISVAMATYNGEKYVIKQLESIYNQSILPDEIIIVDDCSTDNTIALIKEYIMTHQEINCKLYINSVNVGYKKNFYRALQSTSGDIIFLANKDDEWKENKIKCIIKVFQENESVLSVNSSIEYIDDK